MKDRLLTLFLKVRESFDDVKEKVSLIKPYMVEREFIVRKDLETRVKNLKSLLQD